MLRLIILTALGIFAYLYFNQWKKSSAAERKKMLWKTALAVLGITLIALVVTGRISVLFAMVAAAVPFFRRLFTLLRYLPVIGGWIQQVKGQTQTSETSHVSSRLLKLHLNHASGQITGEVLAGQFSGQTLDALSMEQLRELFDEALHLSPDTLPLLEAYCAGRFGPQWRAQFGFDEQAHSQHSASTHLSLSDALQILGLEKNASQDDVIKAHRRLIQKFHPDRGGTNYLAHIINEAKTVVLKSLGAG